MSVTFWMPDAPTERVQPYDDEPDYYETVPVPPFMEINLSNSNAYAIVQLISPQDAQADYICGTWDQAALARVRAATISALNRRGVVESATTPGSDTGGPGTGMCRVIDAGRDADYVTQRLQEFLTLTKVAMDHNFNVSFG